MRVAFFLSFAEFLIGRGTICVRRGCPLARNCGVKIEERNNPEATPIEMQNTDLGSGNNVIHSRFHDLNAKSSSPEMYRMGSWARLDI